MKFNIKASEKTLEYKSGYGDWLDADEILTDIEYDEDYVGLFIFDKLVDTINDPYGHGYGNDTRKYFNNPDRLQNVIFKKVKKDIEHAIKELKKLPAGSHNPEVKFLPVFESYLNELDHIQARVSYMVTLFKLGLEGKLPNSMPLTNGDKKLMEEYNRDYEMVLRLCEE